MAWEDSSTATGVAADRADALPRRIFFVPGVSVDVAASVESADGYRPWCLLLIRNVIGV